ncbi:hypothetical protein TNCV_1719611, partial [Trichonephila clavipes]
MRATGNAPRNFEPQSRDEDTLAGSPSSNYHNMPT